MQLSDLPNIIFSPSADDIVIPAGGDVVVATTIADVSGNVIFDNSSTYSPSADGSVHLAELSELVNAAVLTTFSPRDMLTAGVRSASCSLKVAVTGGSTLQTRALYMWRNLTEVKPMFATQVRHRRVVEGQPMPVSILTAGQSGLKLVVGAAYRLADGGGLAWRETVVEPDCSGDYFTVTATTSAIRAITTAPVGSTLLYYVLTLFKGDAQADCIRFDIDRSPQPSSLTHFVYLNLFGVPDCLSFRGKSTEEQELDSDFGYAGREYIRLDAQLTESHKANSGWLRSDERHAVYDLMSSPYAFVSDDGTLRRITVTEVDSSVSRPTSEPDNVQFTWQFADTRLMRQPFVTPDTGQAAVFAKPPFDKSFS